MLVKTKAYGLIDVDERQKITFDQGLFGFEPHKEFVLLDAERPPFYWLQAMDDEDVAFVLLNPFQFRPDYAVDVDNEELLEIGITDPKKALIFTVITIPKDGSPMTANLLGPLVINRDTRQGRQVILPDPGWKTKHDVLGELQLRRDSSC
ncbi:MAG: flagellar assembly protein FliW [Spirochaetaceae bacterium]|jgi:flagellar assembly factor FliW|nr:flagellar assembly protein FliW [Spirochaetaceae bacterium]